MTMGGGKIKSVEVDESLVAFTEERAAALARVSPGTLRTWSARRWVRPSIVARISERNTVRLYDFQDMTALLVLADVTKAGGQKQAARLMHAVRGVERPLTSLRWGVLGNESYVDLPGVGWIGGKRPDQLTLKGVIDVAVIHARIRKAVTARRPRELQGKIVRTRKVRGSRPVFAGTRIPLSSVQAYVTRGASDARILEAYPALTKRDLQAARRSELAS